MWAYLCYLSEHKSQIKEIVKRRTIILKKLLLCILTLVALFSISMVCFAGDIPECLLNNEDSQVYFGEVKSVDGDEITVIQFQNIKGEFSEGSEITYPEFSFTISPIVGEIYLCGYTDENNPLRIWEVTSLNTKELKLKNTSDMSKRMQEYLNDGKFEEKEERLLKIAENKEVESTIEATTTEVLVTDIGTVEPILTDANTQVSNISIFIMIFGVILIGAVGILLLLWRKQKNSTGS